MLNHEVFEKLFNDQFVPTSMPDYYGSTEGAQRIEVPAGTVVIAPQDPDHPFMIAAVVFLPVGCYRGYFGYLPSGVIVRIHDIVDGRMIGPKPRFIVKERR